MCFPWAGVEFIRACLCFEGEVGGRVLGSDGMGTGANPGCLVSVVFRPLFAEKMACFLSKPYVSTSDGALERGRLQSHVCRFQSKDGSCMVMGNILKGLRGSKLLLVNKVPSEHFCPAETSTWWQIGDHFIVIAVVWHMHRHRHRRRHRYRHRPRDRHRHRRAWHGFLRCRATPR